MVAPRSAGPPAATRRTGLPQVCPSMQKKVLGRVSAGAAAASAWLLSLMAASIGAALAFGNAPAGGGGGREIGRGPVCTPVTNAQFVCRPVVEKHKIQTILRTSNT